MTVFMRMRPPRPDVPTHRFAVGQTVQLKDRFGMSPKSAESYRVTSTLPARDNSLQYRIRNDYERYERVVTEDNLEPGDASPLQDNRSLIERTFQNGQGTEAQQSRDTKAEAGEGSGEA